jgi:hypothetical protein
MNEGVHEMPRLNRDRYVLFISLLKTLTNPQPVLKRISDRPELLRELFFDPKPAEPPPELDHQLYDELGQEKEENEAPSVP